MIFLQVFYFWKSSIHEEFFQSNTFKHKTRGPLWRCRSGKTIFWVTRYFLMQIKGLSYAGDRCHQ